MLIKQRGFTVIAARFNATLTGLFAALALILACVGVFGVISYSVAQRTHEIGVPLALGARSPDVMKLVIGQGIRLTLAGVALRSWASCHLDSESGMG